MRSKIIGKNIKNYRIEKGYTQKQFAALINKSYATVRMYECGGVAPSPYSMMVIAQVLEISVCDILKGEWIVYES